MESIRNNLAIDESTAPAVCRFCFGCGFEDPDGKGNRPCRCRREKLRQIAVSRIPERNRRNGIPILEELRPIVPREHVGQSAAVRASVLAWQTKLIGFVRKHPFRSINLCGSNKIGKSQIGYALYLNAFEKGRTARCFKMAELLADYAKFATQSFQHLPTEDAYRAAFVPRLTVDELASAPGSYTVLIDEFHNVLPSFTEAQMRTTFEILDAIKAHGHQLILLSNFPFQWLRKAMHARQSKLGESVIYVGDAIVSRISEDAVTEELFI